MISMSNVMKLMAVLSILSFLFAFGSGCSASKEAMASTPQSDPGSSGSPAPAVDYAQN